MEAQLLKQRAEGPEVKKPNLTGIPAQMKLNFEQRSGLSFDDVRVHYNSDKPARLGALAYTQGTQIHVGPGQERSLPHELGHVIQQKAGKVRPTRWIGGLPVNDQPMLEREADAWAAFAGSLPAAGRFPAQSGSDTMQMLMPVQFDGWNWPDFFKSSFWSAADALMNMLQTGIRLLASDSSGSGLSEAILSGIGACLQLVNIAGLYNRRDSMPEDAVMPAVASTLFAALADILSAAAGVFLSEGDQEAGKGINNYDVPVAALAGGLMGLGTTISMYCNGTELKGKRRTFVDGIAVVLDMAAQILALIPGDGAVPILSWTALLLEVVVRICRYFLTVCKWNWFTGSDADQNDPDGGSDSSSGSSFSSSSGGSFSNSSGSGIDLSTAVAVEA